MQLIAWFDAVALTTLSPKPKSGAKKVPCGIPGRNATAIALYTSRAGKCAEITSSSRHHSVSFTPTK